MFLIRKRLNVYEGHNGLSVDDGNDSDDKNDGEQFTQNLP